MLNIVLVEPEIPQNTGNIARTCAATGSVLHLVEPLGFSMDEKAVRRAGLDYWNLVEIHTYKNIKEFFTKNPDGPYFYSTTKGIKVYSDTSIPENAYLLFGKETKGLPEDLLKEHPERCIRIPMIHESRSLNLSNSVAIVAYEALRQNGFPKLQELGHFPE